ncbi:hypothetical protein ACFL7M_16705 [Thermodesulfobacteriota bacterium]
MGLKQATLYDPLAVFRESKTPLGLYARKRWLGESPNTWKTDFRETVGFLEEGQDKDGSWNHSVLETVKRLFGLHLTVRDPDKTIDDALDWLTEQLRTHQGKKRASFSERLRNSSLKGLPFTRGCSQFFLTGATLFLSSIFGREKDTFLLSLYRRLDSLGRSRLGRWCGWSCSNNIIRAFVVHPVYANKESVSLAVRALDVVQGHSGRWPRPVPFYQTVNALSHLKSKEADIQVNRAFKWLHKNQNSNGTWGRVDKEWNTFLVVHAMKNKKLI